ncbi:hypothetical protein OG792_23650 [Micromonospora sp. NBC_01699]|uniref:hypothetical protein n=1 Tax=Micromonospora sp. NBC_01699 TaxID=2975984 RepID=UPI002E2B0A2F|nr:hypothetical protein [Micromonospora sp. NBC_01699]
MSETPPQPPPPDFLSEEDLDDVRDVLSAHAPMRVAVASCSCGQAYPCLDVQWARPIKQVAEAGG